MRTRPISKGPWCLVLLFTGVVACGSPSPNAHHLQGQPENVEDDESQKNSETGNKSETDPDDDGHRKIMTCNAVDTEATYDLFMGMKTPDKTELPEGLKMLASKQAIWFFVSIDGGGKIDEILRDARGFLHTDNDYFHHYYRQGDQVRVLNVKKTSPEDGKVEGYVTNFDLANDRETGPQTAVICEDLMPTPGKL